jgi:hypothetical protein
MKTVKASHNMTESKHESKMARETSRSYRVNCANGEHQEVAAETKRRMSPNRDGMQRKLGLHKGPTCTRRQLPQEMLGTSNRSVKCCLAWESAVVGLRLAIAHNHHFLSTSLMFLSGTRRQSSPTVTFGLGDGSD